MGQLWTAEIRPRQSQRWMDVVSCPRAAGRLLPDCLQRRLRHVGDGDRLDEYGGAQGIVTAGDLLVAMFGDLPSTDALTNPPVIRLDDGAWSVDGMLSIGELEAFVGRVSPEPNEQPPFRSLGGLMMALLGRVPGVGDTVEWSGLRFGVLEMDRKRVSRLLLRTYGADAANARPASALDRGARMSDQD